MNKKKILYIHHGKGIGGAPLSLLYLINALDKKKYQPVVLFLHYSQVVDLYKQNGIEIVGIVNRYDFSHTKIWWFRWYHLPYFLRSTWDTIVTWYSVANYWLDRVNPDIVHLNTSSLIAWGASARRKNIPVVWHIREPLSEGYFGIRRWIVKKCVAKYSSKILPICNHDALPWKDNPKTQVVYNAVDPVKFDFSISNQNFLKTHKLDSLYDINSPKILFLGGLSQEKGTLVILKAFENVLHRIPNAMLLIAGYFDLNLNSASFYKKFFPVHKFNLEVASILKNGRERVKFIGPIQDVPQAMAVSNVVVFPSTVGHFARPVIEAGFMKKPVIASNLEPLDELVVNNQTGYLIDPKNIFAWADALEKILIDKKLNKKMGEAGYSFCIRHFSISNQVEIIESTYQNFL